MNGDAAVKVGLGGAHLDGNAEALQHLAAALSHDVQADDLLLGASDDKLVVGGALILRLHHGVVHGREARLVYLDIVATVTLDGLGLRQADAANLGMGEDDRGNVVVADLGRRELRRAEQALGQTTAGGNGDGRQLDLASDVAKGVDIVDAAVLELVDLDVATVVELDASLLQSDASRLRRAAHGPDELVDARDGRLGAALVLVGDGELAVSVLFDASGLALLVQVDAEALVLLGDTLLDHGVEVAQEGLVADEQVGFSAEGVEHAGKLDGDVAGADNGNLLGLDVNVEEAIAVDAVLSAGNGRRRRGLAADGDENLLGVDEDLGAVVLGDLDLILGQEAAPAVDVLDLIVVQIALVDAVEALDVGIALVLERGPVEGSRLLDGEAVCFAIVDSLGEGSGVECDLFGDAAGRGFSCQQSLLFSCHQRQGRDHSPNVDAGSSQALVLDDDSLGSKLGGGHAGRTQATTATAENDVVGLLGDGSHVAGGVGCAR
jgi:hypothetical protein